jgi:hypothetical protein
VGMVAVVSVVLSIVPRPQNMSTNGAELIP